MKKVISVILVLAAVLMVFASCSKESKPITSGDFTYVVLEDETAKIVGYSSTDEIITLKLPSALDEYTVTVIGSEAFAGNDKLNVVYLPETVKIIEESAFAGSSIRKLFAHQSVLEEISESAFAECHGLIQVDLPRSLVTVAKNAFYYCEALKTVNFRGNTQNIDEFAFDACEKVTIRTDSENLHVINYANSCNIETKIVER
jgi:hypothetical protein